MGTAYLVGTGPGDPGLLTLRAARLIARADAVVFDAAVGARILELIPARSERVAVERGSADAGGRLSDLASRYAHVVRLYRGDPFLQGAGAREAAALAAAGIPFEVVPGIPVVTAAAGFAGIPLVSADATGASIVIRATARETPERRGEVTELTEVSGGDAGESGVAGGGPGDASVLITDAGGPGQRVLGGGELAGWSGDGVEIRGAAVRSGARFAWLESRPLQGKRVVVTRPREQADEFIDRLEELGAEVVPFATIRIVDPPEPAALREAARAAGDYDWIVFTSVNGVTRFWEALREEGGDTRDLGGVSICAIGPATAAAIEREGAAADLVPSDHVAEAVVEAIIAQGDPDGKRILLPRALEARSVLPDSLRALGAEVDDVAAYRAEIDAAGSDAVKRRLAAGEIDVITFTASSTVRNFVAAVGNETGRATVASIGPITSATARELGLSVAVEAAEYTVPGLVEAMLRHFGEGSGR
jgi:uroporphyrinogen III methyltransferase / synthase